MLVCSNLTSSGCFDELFKCRHVAVRVAWSSFRGGSRRHGPQSVGNAAPSWRRGLEPSPHLGGEGSLPHLFRLPISRHRGAQRGAFWHPQNLRYEFFAGRLTSQVGHCRFRHLHESMIFLSPRFSGRLVLCLPLSDRRMLPR